MDCSLAARLLFIGMWNFADDYGRLPHMLRSLKAKIFPSDDVSAEDMEKLVNELSSVGLILIYSHQDQDFIEITGWEKHQKIDNRGKAKYPGPFREESIDQSQPSLDSPSEESEKKSLDKEGSREGKGNSRAAADAARMTETRFEEFWKAKPRRKGADPKQDARKAFFSAVKSGADPAAIVAAAAKWARDDADKTGTEFIPMAATWLRQRRFEDCAEAAAPEVPLFKHWPGSEPFLAWKRYCAARDDPALRTMGRQLERRELEGRPYEFPSEWPPGYVKTTEAA